MESGTRKMLEYFPFGLLLPKKLPSRGRRPKALIVSHYVFTGLPPHPIARFEICKPVQILYLIF